MAGSKRKYIARCVKTENETIVTFPAIPNLCIRVRGGQKLTYHVPEGIRSHYRLQSSNSFTVEYIETN